MILAPLFLLLLPLLQGSVCGADPGVGCSLSLGLLLWLAGSLIAIIFITWLLRLGWVFALAYIAAVFALFWFADGVQNALTLVLALLIPAVSALASIPWRVPWYRSWQSWVVVVASSATIVAVSLWVVYG